MNAQNAIQNRTAAQSQPLGLILPQAIRAARPMKRAAGAAFCRVFMWCIDCDADCSAPTASSPHAPPGR